VRLAGAGQAKGYTTAPRFRGTGARCRAWAVQSTQRSSDQRASRGSGGRGHALSTGGATTFPGCAWLGQHARQVHAAAARLPPAPRGTCGGVSRAQVHGDRWHAAPCAPALFLVLSHVAWDAPGAQHGPRQEHSPGFKPMQGPRAHARPRRRSPHPCRRTQWTAPPKHWRSTTSRRTLQHTSSGSLTRSTTPPGTASWAGAGPATRTTAASCQTGLLPSQAAPPPAHPSRLSPRRTCRAHRSTKCAGLSPAAAPALGRTPPTARRQAARLPAAPSTPP
jgi:hypothetical protein